MTRRIPTLAEADLAASPFGTESVMCRIVREALVLLCGGRTVLLQLAHPLVAEGVARHSSFQHDPLARLFRTMRFVDTVLLDDVRRPQALERFHAMHEHIHGRLEADAGPYPSGTRYDGTDPELKLWVHATLVDSCLKAYERFVAPLSDGERDAYFADAATLARMLKIPDALNPSTPAEFGRYMNDMLSGDRLFVTPHAQGLAEDVLYPDVGPAPSAAAALLRFVTAGLLPERFRSAFGLTWGKGRERILKNLGLLTRTLRPHAPTWVWQNPLHEGRLARLLLGRGGGGS